MCVCVCVRISPVRTCLYTFDEGGAHAHVGVGVGVRVRVRVHGQLITVSGLLANSPDAC